MRRIDMEEVLAVAAHNTALERLANLVEQKKNQQAWRKLANSIEGNIWQWPTYYPSATGLGNLFRNSVGILPASQMVRHTVRPRCSRSTPTSITYRAEGHPQRKHEMGSHPCRVETITQAEKTALPSRRHSSSNGSYSTTTTTARASRLYLLLLLNGKIPFAAW